ncbi:LysR family transcriptional regulator [Agrobacterium tumefaciens]|uniref:Transcriptional regulator n=1 Tax=Pararhizobium polonicum TaxID=1612624 RepID=A0A1C7P834_9HYPH|nr:MULTISPECIES: LysR substrate-binding domain-containing protein [Rhizobium/Agrobacterium group]MQB08072.1 LysR family transcriptional regulator [Agrobacterium tumefaciens]NTH16489.1 LysR family transcriptional regulator [Rhizobium rhizogenes]OBZ97423.1 transcriptional regulator [Pararhizobium polonicum]TRB17766.1 LysR family transcriptional regulator [Rhizobium rhizogenes]
MRNPSLRQLEALMAVVEAGTVSRAAEILRISQPAASKLIQDLEADTGLQLFERDSGRLVPTGRGMRLYEEVERIFGGVHQLARAVDAIRREEHGHLVVGTMPALSGPYITRVLSHFRIRHPDVFVSVEARSSQFLTEAVLLRRLDCVMVTTGLEHPSVISERLSSPPAVAILPRGHRLSRKTVITPVDFADEPFISFAPSSMMRRKVDAAFEAVGLQPRIVIEATTAPNVAEFVAAGFGVTVGDPLSMEVVANRVTALPFKPELSFEYEIIRPIRARNSSLVADFVEAAHAAAFMTSIKQR